MDNTEKIISSFLNLSQSDIDQISISTDSSVVSVKLKSYTSKCPFCDSSLIESKGFYKRKISVPVSSLKSSKVVLLVKRWRCNNCGHSFSDSKHMAPANHTVSYSSVLQVMDLLKSPAMTFKQAAALTAISESTVVRIFDNHCHIPRIKLPEALCIDEVYTKNSSFDSKFSCLFSDFFEHTIVDFLPSRRKRELHRYLTSIPEKERNNVKYVCMDMYKPYKDMASIYFKKAIICADSFHVVKHINDDLNQIRIRLSKRYPSDSQEYYLLKNFRFLLFDRSIDLDNKAKWNKKFQRYLNFRQLLDMILSIDIDLYNGYNLKERYFFFNNSSSDIERFFDLLLDDFIKADIPEYREFVGLLLNWRTEIINSFSYYRGRRINNSVAESLNAQVKLVLYNSKGIRNSERRRKRIMYAVNKSGFLLK